MFTKIFFLGLLTVLVCQHGVNASSASEVEKLSLKELVDKVKEFYSQLQELVGGVIGDALGSLESFLDVLRELRDKYLQSGIDGINSAINDVVEFIKESTKKAQELGIDISECVADHQEQISELGEKLIDKVKTCVTDIVKNAEESLKNDIVAVKEIVANVTALPGKIAKCFVGLKPFSCLSNLLKESSSLVITIPQEVASIVSAANAVVSNLPTQLTACGKDVATVATSTSENIISDISTCVKNKLSESEKSIFMERDGLGDIIKQIRAAIAQIRELVTGAIAEAIATLKKLIEDASKLASQVASEGVASISGGIGNVYDYIKNVTERAVELGADISVCISGREQLLEKLTSELTSTFSNCVSSSRDAVTSTIKGNIKIINEMITESTKLTIKLSKCFINLKPITCLKNLLKDATDLLTYFNEKVHVIVNESSTLVNDLSEHLQQCVSIITETTSSRTQEIISEIKECAEDIFSGINQRISLQEVIENVKESIARLHKLVTETIANAISSFTNTIKNLTELSHNAIAEGTSTISSAINSVTEHVNQITQHANEVGADISSCTEGLDRQLEQLSAKLNNMLKQCVSTPVNDAISSIQHETSVLQNFAKEVARVPLKFSKCLINLKPLACFQHLLEDVNNLESKITEQVASSVNNATAASENVASQLTKCTATVADASVSSVEAIISQFGTCANRIIDAITGY